MATVRYFDLVREMRDAYNHRLRLVQSAREIGVKPTARLFVTTVPTVRKWLRRYQQQGLSGLREHSRAHHSCPHKTSQAIEQQVIALRQKLPTFDAARLKREFDLPLSHMAMQRIWREHGLLKPRKKKYQRKQDLAASKATWALFQQISADTLPLARHSNSVCSRLSCSTTTSTTQGDTMCLGFPSCATLRYKTWEDSTGQPRVRVRTPAFSR